MSKRAGQRAHDFHAELLPQANGRSVARDNEVELQRSKTEPARLLQTMFAIVRPIPSPRALLFTMNAAFATCAPPPAWFACKL